MVAQEDGPLAAVGRRRGLAEDVDDREPVLHAQPHEQPGHECVDGAVVRLRDGGGPRPRGRPAPPHRRGDRRRLDDGWHGLRGAQQHRPRRRSACIIVLNDNGRSYAPTVSNLSAGPTAVDRRSADHPSLPDRDHREAVARPHRHPPQPGLRAPPAPARAVPARRCPSSARRPRRAIEAFKAAVREFLQPPSFFEALGVRYAGPIDGHDIEELEARAAQRRRAVGRRTDPRPRPHPEGSRLPAGRGRRREAPPRRAGVRPASSGRRRPCRPATPRRSPRRSSRRPRPTRSSWRSPRRCPGRPA